MEHLARLVGQLQDTYPNVRLDVDDRDRATVSWEQDDVDHLLVLLVREKDLASAQRFWPWVTAGTFCAPGPRWRMPASTCCSATLKRSWRSATRRSPCASSTRASCGRSCRGRPSPTNGHELVSAAERRGRRRLGRWTISPGLWSGRRRVGRQALSRPARCAGLPGCPAGQPFYRRVRSMTSAQSRRAPTRWRTRCRIDSAPGNGAAAGS